MFRQSLPNCGITQTDTFGQPSWKKCRPFARHLDQWDPLPWWALPHSLKDEHGLIGVWAQLHRGRANNHQVWARPHQIWPHPHMRQPSFLFIFSRDFGCWWHHPLRGWAFQCEGVLRPFRGQKIITDETFVEGWLGFKQTLVEKRSTFNAFYGTNPSKWRSQEQLRVAFKSPTFSEEFNQRV